MKHTKKIIAIVTVILSATVLGSHAIMTSAVGINIFADFENGSGPFTALYGNASITYETEENGNKYAKISYNGEANRDREYYDVKVADIEKTYGVLQVNYDLMYPEADTEKNGDIHFKMRKGPGSQETDIAVRFGKNYGYFRMHHEDGNYTRMKDVNGKYLAVEPGHWYSVKIIMDMMNAEQCMYIFDRDTQKLLYSMDLEPTVNDVKDINMITFSSGTDICIDNLKIFETELMEAYIVGSPYVTSATKNPYYMLGMDPDGNVTYMPEGETEWYLETQKEGVSVDSATGRIIVGSRPEPGTVMLCGKIYNKYGSYEARMAVEVSQ